MKRTILLLATLLLACGAINAQNLVFHDVRDLVEDSNAPKFAIFTEEYYNSLEWFDLSQRIRPVELLPIQAQGPVSPIEQPGRHVAENELPERAAELKCMQKKQRQMRRKIQKKAILPMDRRQKMALQKNKKQKSRRKPGRIRI